MAKPSPLSLAVSRFLTKHRLAGQRILVAVSGGPDSLALLHALHQQTPVAAAHLNHQLRGKESDEDQQFVEEICRAWGIECHVDRLDVRAQAALTKSNLEGTARRLRYDWLAKTASDCGIPSVATGHTADDQAETVLHHLIRGTGLRGLRGIAPRRPLASRIQLIRPLLKVTRTEVEAYLNEHHLQTRLDSTNLDPSLTRNRIRHQLLPLLREQYNPRIAQRLAHLAEQAAAAVRLQLRRVRQLLRRCEKPRAASVIVLDWDALRESTTFPEVREVFRWLWEREHWPLGELDQLRLDQLAELVHGSSKAVDLPGGIRAVRQGKVVKLWREAKRLPKSTQ